MKISELHSQTLTSISITNITGKEKSMLQKETQSIKPLILSLRIHSRYLVLFMDTYMCGENLKIYKQESQTSNSR